MAPFPSPTKTYHKDTYSAIDPSRPELSTKDKTVIVTGAGSGIGAEVALSFAKAGAPKIALIGRTEKTLQATKDSISKAYPDVNVVIAVADVSKGESIGRAAHDIRAALGAWDIFANFAAVMPDLTTLAGADEEEWWKTFEVTAKFPLYFAKHFIPKARPGATLVNSNAGACHIAAAAMPKMSAYMATKLAAAKLDEYIAIEHPQLRVFTLHPGIVETQMFHKALGVNDGQIPMKDIVDTAALPADFTVWLASPEAEFLRGRYVWVNWDVEELIARKSEIEADPLLLTISLGGWPFQ